MLDMPIGIIVTVAVGLAICTALAFGALAEFAHNDTEMEFGNE